MKVELINLLDPRFNQGGEFATATLTEEAFIAERTIGVPARFAVQELSSSHFRFIIAHRIDEIQNAWGQGVTGWMKPFDPRYTHMWPAWHRLRVPVPDVGDSQLEWMLDAPAYQRSNLFSADIGMIGHAYVSSMKMAIRDHLSLIPDGEPIAVSLSGGMDSSGVLTTLLHVLDEEGRANPVHCMTLAIDGGGSDLAQADEVATILANRFPNRFTHHTISIDSSSIDHNDLMTRTSDVIEDYRILDLESAMAAMVLFDAVSDRQKSGDIPNIAFEFNGDGGNEVFLDYPFIGRGHRPIELGEVWSNPHLFLFGRMRGAGVNPTFSAGLSRGYVRTFNTARVHGVATFSPLIDRRVIDVGARIPLQALAPTQDALHLLRAQAVQAGVESLTGVTLPIFPKVMFQDGASGKPGLIRVTEEDSRRLKNRILGVR